MVNQTEIRMTAAEFAQLPESNQITQLINGVLVKSPSPLDRHQDVVLNLALLLRGLGHGKVVVAPMDVYLDDVNVFQPDVFWIAPESACINRDGYYYGPPDLVVEVLSPGTARQDRQDKYRAYESSGVREYWIVDPAYDLLEAWTLRDGQFERLGAFGADDLLTSPLLGNDVKLEPIFAD